MNEALLISLHDAIQNEEFSLFQIFIDDDNLMKIYKEKEKHMVFLKRIQIIHILI